MGDAIYVTYLVNFLSRDAPASSVPPPTSRKSANDDYEEEEEEEEEGERQNLRAMGTLHIGRIGMRGRAEEEGRRVFKVHWADGGRGGEREDYFGQRSRRGEERTRLAGCSGIRKFHDCMERTIDRLVEPTQQTLIPSHHTQGGDNTQVGQVARRI